MNYTHETDGHILWIMLKENLIGVPKENPLFILIDENIEKGIIKCAVDISTPSFISSMGLGTLMVMLTKFRNKGGELVLINPSPHINKLLIITKLNAIFTIVDTKEEASKALNEEMIY